MKVDIFAEDKPAEKVFVYKLEVADDSLYFLFENRGF